jgi:hypothetical protein
VIEMAIAMCYYESYAVVVDKVYAVRKRKVRKEVSAEGGSIGNLR